MQLRCVPYRCFYRTLRHPNSFYYFQDNKTNMIRKDTIFMSFLILCLPLLSDGNCFRDHMYGKQTKDYRLEGFQIQTLLARGILTCFQSCLKHEKCESINFDNYSGVCELNSKSLSGSEQLIYRQGNIFVQSVAIKRVSQILSNKSFFKYTSLLFSVRLWANKALPLFFLHLLPQFLRRGGDILTKPNINISEAFVVVEAWQNKKRITESNIQLLYKWRF